MTDLISRDAAIKALTSSADYIADALERLEKIPAVEAVPVVHGRWTDGDTDYFARATCSVCGSHPWRGFVPSADMVVASGKYNFCPTCGARMDGDDND